MSDDEADSAMREMMGFSSFGMEKPKFSYGKKDASESANPKPSASGANNTPVSKKVRLSQDTTKSSNTSSTILLPASLRPDIVPRAPQTHSIRQPNNPPTDVSASTQTWSTQSSSTRHSASALPFTPSTMSPPPGTSAPTNRTDDATSAPLIAPAIQSSTLHNISPIYPTATAEQLAKGAIRNSRGDRVFFKPGFIVQDPWARLRGVDTGIGIRSAPGVKGR